MIDESAIDGDSVSHLAMWTFGQIQCILSDDFPYMMLYLIRKGVMAFPSVTGLESAVLRTTLSV